MKSGSLNFLEPSGPVVGLIYLYCSYYYYYYYHHHHLCYLVFQASSMRAVTIHKYVNTIITQYRKGRTVMSDLSGMRAKSLGKNVARRIINNTYIIYICYK